MSYLTLRHARSVHDPLQHRLASRAGPASEALGPYSQGIKVGGFIYTAGQGGIDPASGQIVADFLGSQEYFQGHNASAGDWLSSVYQYVLSRQPDQSGYDSWLGVLAANR